MTSGVAVICFLIAFIFFVLAAIGVAWPRLNFVAAGMGSFQLPIPVRCF